MAKVRADMSNAPPPTFTQLRSGILFRTIRHLSANDVAQSVRQLEDKSIPSPTLSKLL